MTTENTTEKQKGVTTGVIFLIIMMFACLIISLVMCSGSSDEPETVRDEPKEAYDRVMLMTVTEDYVKNYLVSPSTADFPRNQDWKITDNGSVITVSSYVDAQNSLGGTVREHFTAKYKLPDVTLTYLEIGGEVMIEY
jgi:hypothetical protein